MTIRKRGSQTHKSPNYLPEHVCIAFEKGLDSLVENLASSGTPKALYLKSEYRSKYLDSGVGRSAQRRAAALAKWLATEERNRTTNQRLYEQQFEKDFGWVTSDRLILKAREIIRNILGESHDFSLDRGSFTNGASTRVRRSEIAAIQKHSGQAHVTSSAVKHWMLDSAKGSILSQLELSIQESSVFFTVPKSTDIDRVACKEPEINAFMQREVGHYIRRRLKRKAGIDLLDQTRNQRLAASAWSNNLATLDLSSASDSISSMLVELLLPWDWFCILDDLRVKTTIIDGQVHELSMFSSMGNGFTFELETLLFYALVRSICYFSGVKGELSVYGDDIICSSSVGPRVARIFHWLGFSVNPKKSNWSGPLRESCGKHFHMNWDVTPFYLRKPISCKTDVIRILNRLLEWSSEGTGIILDTHVLLFHRKWSNIIPRSLWGGHDSSSDGSLVTGTSFNGTIVPKVATTPFPHDAGLAWWLTTKRSAHSELSATPSKTIGHRIAYWSNSSLVKEGDDLYAVPVTDGKTGWQRPRCEVSPYLLECFLLRPNIREPLA